MNIKTVRYTATLPSTYIDELKTMTKDKIIPSINYAINEALDDYMKNRLLNEYDKAMKEAGQDKAFIARTMECFNDFDVVDSETLDEW